MNRANVSLRQLRAFIEVADSGSFTQAARRISITQSGLSILIKELEKELEVKLFDRHSRMVELTTAGREFYPLARRTLNSLDDAVDNIRELRQLKRGRLKVGAPQMLASTHLPLVAARFQQQHPNVDITLIDGTLTQHIEKILSGDLDIAVGPDTKQVDGVRADVLSRREVMVVFSPEHELAALKTISWNDLKNHCFITPSSDFIPSVMTGMNAELPTHLQFKSVQVVDYMTTAIGMAHARLGFTICPAFATPFIKGYELEMRHLHDPAYFRNLYTYVCSRRSLSPLAEAFIGCLFEYFQSEDAK